MLAEVAVGSFTSILACLGDVCLSPHSDNSADIRDRQLRANSCREQAQQMTSLFDHLVGAQQKRFRDRQAESLGCTQVDDQFQFGRQFYG